MDTVFKDDELTKERAIRKYRIVRLEASLEVAGININTLATETRT